jgi:hypothetical protein
MGDLFYRLGEVWKAATHWPCWRKESYPDRLSAVRHMLKLSAAGKAQPERGRLNAFLCRHCGRWHVGHTRFRVGNGVLLEMVDGDTDNT